MSRYTQSPGPQRITRIPPYRPGTWVKIKPFEHHEERGAGSLSGQVARVRTLTCTITTADQKAAVWRVVFEDGRCLEWHRIERAATAAEIAAAEKRS